MIYKVRGRFKAETAATFLQKLSDGTIEQQRPDGAEIIASMNRAVVTSSGHVQWSELCYCPSPLQHERTTVLDHHFDDLSTEPIDGYQHYDGKPFMDYLKELATSS
ncbi:MAG: hypothetical protein OEU92_09905 [Alphaproteobacteria bacterium]|nr:hypothetical protein [Alphaproteobacteria bacterium]